MKITVKELKQIIKEEIEKINNDADAPSEIDSNGTKIWLNSKEQFHRDGNLPAIVYTNGDREWYKNRQLHRDRDLPAAERVSGYREWWLNGKFIRREIS